MTKDKNRMKTNLVAGIMNQWYCWNIGLMLEEKLN